MAKKISRRRTIVLGTLAWIIGLLDCSSPSVWTALASFKAEADAYAMPQTLFASDWTAGEFCRGSTPF